MKDDTSISLSQSGSTLLLRQKLQASGQQAEHNQQRHCPNESYEETPDI